MIQKNSFVGECNETGACKKKCREIKKYKIRYPKTIFKTPFVRSQFCIFFFKQPRHEGKRKMTRTLPIVNTVTFKGNMKRNRCKENRQNENVTKANPGLPPPRKPPLSVAARIQQNK